MTTKRCRLFALASLLVLGTSGFLASQVVAEDQKKDQGGLDLSGLMSPSHNEMAIVVTRYGADQGNLTRFYNVTTSPNRHERMIRFHKDWAAALQKVDGDKLTAPAKKDLEQLKKRVANDLAQVEAAAKAQAEIAILVPFAPVLVEMLESHQRVDKMDGMKAAAGLNTVKLQIQQMRKSIATGKEDLQANVFRVTKVLADRAADTTAGLKGSLGGWFGFYNLYDPMFTWWTTDLYKEVDKMLGDYATLLRGKAAGTTIAASTVQLPEWAKLGDPTSPRPKAFPVTESDVPNLAALMSRKPSEMRDVLAKFLAERGGSKGGGGKGGKGVGKGKGLADIWMTALNKIDFDKLSQEGKVDYLFIKHSFDRDIVRGELQTKTAEAMGKLVPFETIVDKMEEAVLKPGKKDPAKLAQALVDFSDLIVSIQKAQGAAEKAIQTKDSAHPVFDPVRVVAAIDLIKDLRSLVKKCVDGGGAEFAEEASKPGKVVDAAMQKYAQILEANGIVRKDKSGINGRPIGRDALMAELYSEMVAMTPEELLGIADVEYAFCEAEMKKASREMGFGDDWLKAVEKVKQAAVPPGGQPVGIRDLVWEAIHYLWKHDLITVPSVAGETWTMSMMSPKQQLVNPFFTGGARISVSYPTNTMAFDARLQSMRGNNLHFSKATAHHEVIPGHNLQGFMNARYGNKRGSGTSFWGEGGALYWEFVLYEKGFAEKPEDRAGFLFWRMHRCARIHFSLNFHMGKWTPQECIDYLVTKVGHERDNAAGEVRRSFGTSYGPLYQLAYMIGGKQLYAMRKELVLSGKMPEKEFHDKIWEGGSMPIEMVRALVGNTPLTREWRPNWKIKD